MTELNERLAAEWMLVKPCLPDCKQRDAYCPPHNRFGCPDYKEWEAAVDAQEKLLDFLIESAQMNVDLGATEIKAETVLKQLSEMRYQLRRSCQNEFV